MTPATDAVGPIEFATILRALIDPLPGWSLRVSVYLRHPSRKGVGAFRQSRGALPCPMNLFFASYAPPQPLAAVAA